MRHSSAVSVACLIETEKLIQPLGYQLPPLNKKVFAELFLTPASDPWLGLYSPETYVALDGGGVR